MSNAERDDFILLLEDVSSRRWSRARRLVSTVSLGLFGPSKDVRDANDALELLEKSLGQSGFRVTRIHGRASSEPIALLLRGSDARLRREHYREQLDAWMESKARGEFVPHELPASTFTPARRLTLLRPPLVVELLPELGKTALRPDLLAVLALFPLHDRRFAAQLLSQLCRRLALPAQLLHALRNEYGEKIAFYFAFRSFHQQWLALPAALGVCLWCLQIGSPRLAGVLTPLFGLALPLWGSVFLSRWRSQQRGLASLWNVDDLREAEVVRPEFVGERVHSRLTGAVSLHYPSWKRALKRCVTVPVLGAQLLLLTGVIIGLYTAWLHIHASSIHPALTSLLVVLISMAWGVIVELLNWHVFLNLASALNKCGPQRARAPDSHRALGADGVGAVGAAAGGRTTAPSASSRWPCRARSSPFSSSTVHAHAHLHVHAHVNVHVHAMCTSCARAHVCILSPCA